MKFDNDFEKLSYLTAIQTGLSDALELIMMDYYSGSVSDQTPEALNAIHSISITLNRQAKEINELSAELEIQQVRAA